MKASDLKINKKAKLDEKLSTWIGDTGAAALKQLGNRITGDPEGQMTIAQKAGKERFLNDFVAKAYGALNSAIQSGRVDPNITTGGSASPAEPPKEQPATAAPAGAAPATTPAAASGAPKKAPGNATAPGAGQKQTTQNINNYVQSLAKTLNAEPDKGKKMAMAKELVNFMADRKDYPEWGNALATAQQVIKKGVPDPNFANSAISRLKAGQMMEAWQVYWINKLLESIGFTFKDLGFTLLQENKNNGKYILAETKYYKLNNIFESIILNEAESISQFIDKWLSQYMGNIKMADTNTKNLLQKIQDTYSSDKGKAALTQLAQAAFAAMEAGGGSDAATGQPAGADAGGGQGAPASGTTAASGQPAKTGTGTDTIINSIQNLLIKLKGIDPALHSQIIKKIGGGESLQGLPGNSKPAAPAGAAAPAAAPVSENRKKK